MTGERDSIRVGVERLLAYEPEILLTGHTGAVEVTRADLDEFLAWARELELVVGRLAPVPGMEDEALDPYVARFNPYRADVTPGLSMPTSVIVRNHGAAAREARVRVRAPAGWTVAPNEVAAVVPGGGATMAFAIAITAPADAASGRVVCTADVDLGGEPRGEIAETLLEVMRT